MRKIEGELSKQTPEAKEPTGWENVKDKAKDLIKEYGPSAAVGAAIFTALEIIRSKTGVDTNQMAEAIKTYGVAVVSTMGGVFSQEYFNDVRADWEEKKKKLLES